LRAQTAAERRQAAAERWQTAAERQGIVVRRGRQHSYHDGAQLMLRCGMWARLLAWLCVGRLHVTRSVDEPPGGVLRRR